MYPVVVSLLAIAQPDLPPRNLSHPEPTLLLPGTPAGPVLQPPDARWAAAGMPCPGPAAHPFQRLPRICLLKACECDTPGVGGAADPAWYKEFHDAAHVPMPRFTIDGHGVYQDGLLIYEGMRVTVYTNGVYDVSFTAEVPDMPVTLRLQLVLQRPATNRPANERHEYRLTLPPFRLEPKADAKLGDPAANTFHISHRGFSSLLANGESKQVTSDWQITRIGTARFGTALGSNDPFR